MVWARRPQSVTSLLLAVLILGTAGSHGLRSCPHHGGHDSPVSLISPPQGTDGAPAEDPGPCDHDLGVCESVATGPDVPGVHGISTPGEIRTEELRLTRSERIPLSNPPHLLPFSTGPPFHAA